MKKVKQEVIRKIEDKATFAKYMSPENFKQLVVVNIYDKFWGYCEIADAVIKRFLDVGGNDKKVEFIAIDYSMLEPEVLGKRIVQSKPIYMIFHVI